MNYREALAYLDRHINVERMLGRIDEPSLDRMQRLMAVMGDPQHAYPVIHVTGTNGKGSTVQIATRLLAEHGLTVATYTSPHLERLNERISRNGEPIGDEELAEMITAVSELEVLAGITPTWFEIITAAAFRWFADVAVDVAVIEVGMLGRWDATNVVDSRVAVVTNVELDHTEYAGPTRAHIAAEKAGIVKPGSVLVLGETDPDLVPVFKRAGAAAVVERELDFAVVSSELALGGRVLELRTPMATYPEVFLPLHGRHQGDNAAVALTAVEAFFDGPIDPEVVAGAFAEVRMPGRFEVLSHQPLVVIDGAHNVGGATVAADVMSEEFDPAGNKVLVCGFLRGRDPVAMLDALDVTSYEHVILCTPPSPRALPAEETLEAVRDGFELDRDPEAIDDVAAACDRALELAGDDDAVLVTGSLYVVGAARTHLRAR